MARFPVKRYEGNDQKSDNGSQFVEENFKLVGDAHLPFLEAERSPRREMGSSMRRTAVIRAYDMT